MIEIKNLVKKFDSVIAVNNLSVTFSEGVYGIIGENGAGKSTLLRLISNVYLKDEGEILVDGEDNSNHSANKKIFFLSDNPYYERNSTIKQTISLYNSIFDLDENKCFKILEQFDLPIDRRISTFSKGMRRQLFIAIALSMNVKYLLLDEVFDGLDVLILDVIKNLIIQSAEDKVVIVSSHNASVLQNLCNNFIILTKGKIENNGSLEDLASTYMKYQIVGSDIDKQSLEAFGINVIQLTTLGSIIHLITDKEINIDEFKNRFNPYIIENIILTHEEILKINLLVGKENHYE